MEYRLELPQAAASVATVTTELLREDPAALADVDDSGQVWRLSTSLPTHALLAVLSRAGLWVAPGQLSLLPSTCCGGCSG